MTGRIRRAWRSPYWLRPVAAIAALLIGISMFLATYTNLGYRRDRQQAFDKQQTEVEALRDELQCRSRESSAATRLEAELGRIGWPALAAVVLSDDDTQTRQAAERIDEIARALGPALERRAEAVESCD